MKTDVKTIVNVPGWADYFANGQAITAAGQAYSRVPLVYRCVRLIADALASVELRVYTVDGDNKTEVPWPFACDKRAWVWRTAAALLTEGAAYSVKVQRGSRIIDLQWLNPSTITPEAVANADEVTIRFRQTGNIIGGRKTDWDQDEMLYIREYNPENDVLPGASSTTVAITDAGLLRYLTDFAAFYFKQGAMPLTILSVDRNTPMGEVERVQGLFKSIATNVSNAWRVIALRGGKDSAPFTLTPPLSDLAMPELYAQSRQAIAGAFGIPQTMIEDAANYATAAEHRLSFWRDTVQPRGEQITSGLNQSVFAPVGMTCEFAFNELDVFQEDEAERAGSLASLTGAGVPLLIALDVLGYDMTDEQREAIAALSVVEAAPEVVTPGVPDVPLLLPAATEEERRSVLAAWRRKSEAALKRGSPADVEFVTTAYTPDEVEGIRAALSGCETVAQIRACFAQVNTAGESKTEDALTIELRRANDLLAEARERV